MIQNGSKNRDNLFGCVGPALVQVNLFDIRVESVQYTSSFDLLGCYLALLIRMNACFLTFLLLPLYSTRIFPSSSLITTWTAQWTIPSQSQACEALLSEEKERAPTWPFSSA